MTDLHALLAQPMRARLGWAVQEQLSTLLDGAHDPEDADDAYYGLNANAVEMMKTLLPNLGDIDPDAEETLRLAIEDWQVGGAEDDPAADAVAREAGIGTDATLKERLTWKPGDIELVTKPDGTVDGNGIWHGGKWIGHDSDADMAEES